MSTDMGPGLPDQPGTLFFLANPTWDFDVPVRRLEGRLSPEDHAFLTALAGVINNRSPMSVLDAFPQWTASSA